MSSLPAFTRTPSRQFLPGKSHRPFARPAHPFFLSSLKRGDRFGQFINNDHVEPCFVYSGSLIALAPKGLYRSMALKFLTSMIDLGSHVCQAPCDGYNFPGLYDGFYFSFLFLPYEFLNRGSLPTDSLTRALAHHHQNVDTANMVPNSLNL